MRDEETLHMHSMRSHLTLLCALGMVACGPDDASSSESATGADVDNEPSVVEPASPDAALEHAADTPDASGETRRDDKLDAAVATDASSAMDAALIADASADTGRADAATSDASTSQATDGGLDAALRDAAVDAAGPADATTPLDAAKPPDAALPADASVPDANVPAPYSSFTRIYAILDGCNNSCHGPGATFSLDLSTREIAYQELIGGEGKGAIEFITCANMGLFRVVPFNPGQSVLVQKIENTQPCGDKMPPGGSLAASSIAEIRAWINRGAPND